MQRSVARLTLAVVLLACPTSRAVAGFDLSAATDSEPFNSTALIVRAQSPSVTVAPPQLRVAQDYTLQPTPYYPSSAPPCPPGIVVGAPQYDPYAAGAPANTCPWSGVCAGAFGEFLYLKPRNDDVPFAVPVNILKAPTGPVGVTDPGFSWGFRAGGFVSLGSDSRLVGTYTWYRNTSSAEVDATGANVINPLAVFPGTVGPLFVGTRATADQLTRFQMIDVDYEVAAQCCSQHWWGYWLGARAARLDQDFDATFPFTAPARTTSLATGVNFQGIGPRAGVEGERILFPNFGLRAYAKGSASFLVGRFRSSFQQSDTVAGLQASAALNQDRIVPILDFELGLAWVSPEQHVRISAGYMVAAWFNAVTTPEWIQSVQRVDFLPGNHTLTFDGLTARAEVRF